MCGKVHCVYSSRLEYFPQLLPRQPPFDYRLFSFLPPFLKSRLSSGLRILLMLRVLTCVHISVVLLLLCPRSSWIYLKSVPFSRACVAKLCLNPCIDISFLIPALSLACSKTACAVLIDRYLPSRAPSKSHFPGLYFSRYSLSVSRAVW